jgi:hypothetical protein
MREALLRADGRNDLAVRIEVDVEEHLVAIGDRQAKVRDPAAGAVAMVLRIVRRLGEFRDRDVGTRQVRVTEAEVDHVTTEGARLGLELVDLGEDVGW